MAPEHGSAGAPAAPLAAAAQSGGRLVLHVFPTFDPGGPQVRTARLMGALGQSWQHRVIALDGRLGALAAVPAMAAVQVVPARPKSGSLRTAWWLRGVILRLRPCLVVSYNWGGIDGALAAACAGVPFVHHEETVADDERGMAAVRRNTARRCVLPRAAAVVVVTQDLADKAQRRWRVPAGRVWLIPNGVAVPAETATRSCPAEGLRADGPVVGFVGRLRPEKGLLRLLAAMAQLRTASATLLVVGDGPQRAAAEQFALELGLGARVRFAGHQAAVDDYLAAIDVFVLPSHREQLPLALLEAMAHGLPVVATAVGGVAAALPPGQQRYLLPADASPMAMAERLDALLSDPTTRSALGAANRSHAAARYDFDAMQLRYEQLYKRAAAGRATAGGPA